MKEELDRRELPLQAIEEYQQDCHAIVPVHPKILSLPLTVRRDASIVQNLKDTIKEWYDEDIDRHFRILHDEGYYPPEWMHDYYQFKEEWQLKGVPNKYFLDLIWNDGKRDYKILYMDRPPSTLYNQYNEFGEFYTPENILERKLQVEVFYRNVGEPDVVFMSPEKMRKYGNEDELTRKEPGMLEVRTTEFCSESHSVTARAFLLRDFAVAYLNKLLEIANTIIKNN